jgi:hypothetical protein
MRSGAIKRPNISLITSNIQGSYWNEKSSGMRIGCIGVTWGSVLSFDDISLHIVVLIGFSAQDMRFHYSD